VSEIRLDTPLVGVVLSFLRFSGISRPVLFFFKQKTDTDFFVRISSFFKVLVVGDALIHIFRVLRFFCCIILLCCVWVAPEGV
jgi:hypothetical protein